MIRWFDFKFISGTEDFYDMNFDGDGIIFAVLIDDETQLAGLEKIIVELSRSKARYIFVLPKVFVDVREVVKKFSAVKNLKELAEDDPVLFDEYEVIFEDLQAVIKNFIDGYTHPENFRATYIHDGKILHVYRKATLSELMSKICDEVYALTPIINNEVINKNEITNVAANSRNKILAALLRRELEPNLGLRGTGQDVSIMRSTLIRTGVLIGGDNPRINLRPENHNMRNLLDTIENFILEARQNPKSFSVLYKRLISPSGQIGLRRGVIPIYLAAVIHNYTRQITISNRFGAVRTSVDALIQINAAPEDFFIEYLDWSADKENFVASLAKTFSDFVVGEKNSDSCDYVANAMIRWFMSLPKYTKEFKSCPDGTEIADAHIKLRNLFRQSLSGSDLLFKKLPKIFSEDLTATAERIIAAKKFFDGAVDELGKFILDETKKIFSATGDLTAALHKWCASLDKEIFEQLFPDETDKFLRLIKSADDEKIFITELARPATGLRFEDWNDRTPTIYLNKLAQFKASAENFRRNETSERQVILVDGAGTKTVKRLEIVELSPRGKLLFNQITNALDSMGQSISVQEKRQVLTEILRKLC